MSRLTALLGVALLIPLLLGIQAALFGDDNYREDEAWVVHGVLQNTPAEIAQWTAAGVHPPGWLLIADAWIETFGSHEKITRYLSTLFMALSLAFTYRLSCDLLPAQGGLMAVLLLGVTPFVLYYAHELRPYALLLATSAGLQAVFLRYLFRPSPGTALLYVLIGIVGVYTHYFAAYVILAQAVFVILFVRWEWKHYLRIFALFVAVAASLIGWLLPILQSFLLTYEGGIYYAVPTNLDGLRRVYDALQLQPPAIGLFITLLALVTPAALMRFNHTGQIAISLRANWQKWYVPVTLAAVLVIAFGLNLAIRNVTPRNLIVIMPLVAIIGAMGLMALPPRARLILLLILPVYGVANYERLHPTQPYREMTAFIAETYREGGVIVTEVNSAWRWLLTIPYYFIDHLPGDLSEDDIAHLVMPDDLRAFYQTNPDRPEELTHILTSEDDLSTLETLAEDTTQLWTVQAGMETALHDPAQDVIRRRFVPVRSQSWDEPYPLTYTVTEYLGLPQEAAPQFVFGEQVTVLSWTLRDSIEVVPCQTVMVESWLRAEDAITEDYSLTLVIADQEGSGIARQDGAPANLDTSFWQPGWVYRDLREVSVPCDLEAGQYNLLMGMYDPDTVENLPATTPDQNPIGALVYLTTLNVTP